MPGGISSALCKDGHLEMGDHHVLRGLGGVQVGGEELFADFQAVLVMGEGLFPYRWAGRSGRGIAERT